MLPTREEALKLIRDGLLFNPGPWGKHCLTAAHCAEKIASACGDMDVEKAYILGLLHDIGRKFGVRHLGHVYDGYVYMKSLGYDEVAKICLTHSFNNHTIDEYIGKFDVTDEQYRKYGNKKELLAVINEVLFSKWLSGNFFSDEEQIKKINIDSILKKNIFLSRDAIFAWLYKGQSKGIESILHLVSISIIKSSITNGYIGKAVKQFNLMKSLDVYFGGNDMKEEKDRYINIRSNLRSKINQDGDSQIESESEYYYAVGQLVRYYISLNKSKDKNHSLANPFIYVANEGVLKKRLEQLFKKYNYAIKINYNRYNKLYAMIIAYMTEGKVNSEDIIAGYLSDNLIYDSKKSEEEN